MGLNDSFTVIRGQILMMNPLPTLSQCYGMILQEENQREAPANVSNVSENFAMTVRPTKGQFRGKSSVSGYSKKPLDASIICEFCYMSGHLKDKCYCIHGYPTWHMLYGKPKPKPKFLTAKGSVVANVTTNHTPSGTDTVSAGLHTSQSDSLMDSVGN